jgi:broad specificity phosphatase PhoE
MAPSLLLLMRHAEKTSDPKDPDLAEAGVRRAQELVDYIRDTFGTPDFLFASAISKHSARPYETLKPLSKKTGIPIDTTYADQDYGALATYFPTSGIEGRKLQWHGITATSLLLPMHSARRTANTPIRRIRESST